MVCARHITAVARHGAGHLGACSWWGGRRKPAATTALVLRSGPRSKGAGTTAGHASPPVRSKAPFIPRVSCRGLYRVGWLCHSRDN